MNVTAASYSLSTLSWIKGRHYCFTESHAQPCKWINLLNKPHAGVVFFSSFMIGLNYWTSIMFGDRSWEKCHSARQALMCWWLSPDSLEPPWASDHPFTWHTHSSSWTRFIPLTFNHQGILQKPFFLASPVGRKKDSVPSVTKTGL